MKCLRFLFSLIRGPPTDKGVFTGFQPRKDALVLLGDVAERLLHPAVNRRSHGGGPPLPKVPPLACGFKSRHPRHFAAVLIPLSGAGGIGRRARLGP